jgi:PAS domain S-box-containing protein
VVDKPFPAGPGTRPRRGSGRRATDAGSRVPTTPRDLWQALPDHVFELDLDGRIVFANREFPGLPIERMPGVALSGLLPVEHRQAFREACRLAKETRREHRFETQTDGRPPWWLYRVMPVLERHGGRKSLLVVRTDITNQKQASDALAHETQRYRMAFESAKTGMAITGIDGTFLLVNHAMCQLLGYEERELLASDIYAVTHPDDLAESATQARRLLMGKTDTVMVEKRYFHRDGHVIWCRVCATAAADRDGVTQYFVTIVQDINDVRTNEGDRHRHERQESEASRLNSMQSVTGEVAEELSPSVGEILERITELRQALDGNVACQGIVDSLQAAAEHQRELLDQLLTVSLRRPLAKERVSVNTFLRNLIGRLADSADDQPSLRLSLADGLPAIECDIGQVELALLALLDNARDAAPTAGELIVESQPIRLSEMHCREYPGLKPGTYVQITISDSGTGLESNTKGRILDPFFTTKSRQEHRGLGLPLARAIAQQHGGVLTVYSEIGHGTSCMLFLPVGDHGQESVSVPTSLGNETVLLAEDEEALSSVARRLLERLGYNVLTAVDGVEALHMFVAGRDQIDLVLLDISMPRMGGTEAHDRIRAIDRSVPIGFMTGYSAEMAIEALAHSQAVLIPKPFGMDELGEKVREMLDGGAEEDVTASDTSRA